jgi:hypothetical protein
MADVREAIADILDHTSLRDALDKTRMDPVSQGFLYDI